MKQLHLLVWITQLGLSTATPLIGFILLAVWLKDRFCWGNWVIWLGIGLGLYTAIAGFLNCLKTLKRLTEQEKKDLPPVAFNEHD